MVAYLQIRSRAALLPSCLLAKPPSSFPADRNTIESQAIMMQHSGPPAEGSNASP